MKLFFKLSSFLMAIQPFAAHSQEVVRDHMIRINVDASPINLEPPLLTDSMSAWVLHHVADRLVEEHLPGQLQGNLAARWEISADKKSYCFLIASGKKFSDGTLVDAAAVVRSLKLAMLHKAQSRVGFYLANIESVNVKNDSQVCVTLVQPSTNFLQILADASFSIYKKGKIAGSFVYSGKYVIQGWDKAQISLTRIKDKQIFKLEVLSSGVALSRFKAGTLEILRNSGSGGLAQIQPLKVRKAIMPDERTFFIAFNLKSPVFKQLAMRRAFVAKLNWLGIELELSKLGLTRSTTLLSPSLVLNRGNVVVQQAANESASIHVPPFKLLTQRGFELKQIVDVGFRGLQFSHSDLPKPEFLRLLKSGDFDVALTGYGITVRDWDYLSTLFHSVSSHNMIFLNDSSVDNLLQGARESAIPSERIKLYTAVLQKNADSLWYIPVTHTPLVLAFSDLVDAGLQGGGTVTSPWFRFDQVHWKR